MSNSKYVEYTRLSPNCSPRTAPISKITIHHMAVVNGTLEGVGARFADPDSYASANYGIDSDGKVALYVDESKRSWCSSSSDNDNKSITIECANSAGSPDWPISDKCYAKLIDLCVDICERNGIKKLVYTGDASGNLTRHNMFTATACVPVDSEVLTKEGWVKLDDIQVGDEIACADLDGLRITFEEVYAKVPKRIQDTYTNNDLTATKDHRMVYRTQYNMSYKITDYASLLKNGAQVYIPLAGYANGDGLPLSDDMLAFYIAVQADGHYMYETLSDGSKSYYGLEFHFSKERKIDRLKELLDQINLPYNETHQSDGTVKIRVYNHDDINIVEDICEKWLKDKAFTWEWLNLSPEQARFFLDEIMLWDGCIAGAKYSSRKRVNLDIVNAIAAINGVGSRVIGNDVHFRETPYITLGENTVRNRGKNEREVSCVSVKTGIFLVRQHGKTFIIGNCPGPYLQARFPQIAEEVNKRLGKPSAPEPTTLYRVQLGAFAVKENAERLLGQLRAVASDAFIVNVDGLYKVQVGAFSVKANAERLAEKLENQGYSTYITTASGKVSSTTVTIDEGDTVKLREDAKDYDGHSLAGFVYKRNHVVKQLDGDRAVLTYGGDIVCAAKVSDLILVKKG